MENKTSRTMIHEAHRNMGFFICCNFKNHVTISANNLLAKNENMNIKLFLKKIENNSSNAVKISRIVLLILIIIGLLLLFNQDLWLPGLVNFILK
jgi:hypothetical protein